MKPLLIKATIAFAMTFSFTSAAHAAGAIEIGGKTAASANFSITSIHPDKIEGVEIDTVIAYVSTALTRTTENARWEYGVGLTIGVIRIDVDAPGDDGGDITVGSYTPTVQVRINSDLMGPEENFLVYAGALAGVSFLESAVLPDDEVGAFGPKFGAEYYFTPRIAVQLEDILLFDTEKGINNSLSLGVKLLF